MDLETFRQLNNLTKRLLEKDDKITRLEDKIIMIENRHASEMKKLNQLFSQKESERTQKEKELRNKLTNLELEVQEKSSALSIFMSKQMLTPTKNQRCEECERLLSLIKEMEKQIEFYKESVLRRHSVQKTEDYNPSDLKSYYNHPDNSNLELESMIGDGGLNNFHLSVSPKYETRNEVQTKLSFISLSHKKQDSIEKDFADPHSLSTKFTSEVCGLTQNTSGQHSKNISQLPVPKQPLNISRKHRSNCSEIKNTKKYPLESRPNRQNSKGKREAIGGAQVEKRADGVYRSLTMEQVNDHCN